MRVPILNRTSLLSICALALILLPAFSGRAFSEPDPKTAIDLYNEGCIHYEQKDYEGAKDRFLTLVFADWHNADLFYNLANSYFRMGDFGRAILYYEKAKRISPRDDSIAHNLKLARANIIDKTEPADRNIVSELLVGVHSMLSLNEWTIISLVLYLLVMLSLAVILITRDTLLKADNSGARNVIIKISKRVLIVSLILLLYCGTNTLVKAYASSLESGIVVAKQVKVRSGPSEDFAEVFELHSGTSARIHTTKEGWRQISIPSGLSGWLPKESLATI